MHIAFVLSGFFPDNRAGTESYVLNLAKNLIKRGFLVSVIIPVIEIKPDYIYESIPVYTFREEVKPEKRIFAGLKPPKGLPGFRKILEKINPDIVHFHANNRLINSYHVISAKNSGAKTVFTTHLSGIFCIKGNLRFMEREDCDGKVDTYRCTACYLNSQGKSEFKAKILGFSINLFLMTRLQSFFAPQLNIIRHKKTELKKLKKHADVIISISEWIKKTYKVNKIDSVLIPQAVQFEKSIKTKLNISNDRISILYLGRISKIKGLHLLLEALQDLQEHFKLIVAGIYIEEEIEYYNEIKDLTNRLEDNEWHDDLNKEGVQKILERTDILCIPSLVKEMAPLSVLEAFHYKVPVIGSNSGGIKDQVIDGLTGLLFEMGNGSDLKEKLEIIIEDRDLLARLQASIRINFRYDQLIEQHINIYSTLLQ